MNASRKRPVLAWLLALGVGFGSVVAGAAELRVRYDESYEGSDVKAFFRTEAMGTLIRATVFARDKETIGRIAHRFEETLNRHEDLTSAHKPSPITLLNSRSGSWVGIPCETAHVLQKAKDMAMFTDGAFDPTIGTVTDAWKVGFGGRSVPPAEVLRDAQSRVDWRKVGLDFTGEAQNVCQARIGKGQSVDLGGIVKGWSNEILADQVKSEGAHRAMVVLGGNTAFVGTPTYGDKWLSAIPSAQNRNDYVGYFKLDEGDVVTTSSDEERRIDVEGKRYGHIMNGRTGSPAKNAFAYVSVIDRDGARGDALSTALWVMGDKAFDFLKTNPSVRALLVMRDGNVAYVTPSLADRTYVKSDRLTLKSIE